ncbi:MAG: hypothetical protein ACLGIK_16160, partial [Gemmatimonadota bacterium]
MHEISAEAAHDRDRLLLEFADARALVDSALTEMRRHAAERLVGPMIAQLRLRYRHTALEGVERLFERELAGVGESEREVIRRWAETLARRFAHVPSLGLRDLAFESGPTAVATFFGKAEPELARELREEAGLEAADWQLLDPVADRVPGISARRAERELLAGRQPARTVVVAVIDGGIDTAHVDLRDNLWRNPREVAGNGKDDDGNGYVDDTYGWNFLGGANGENVNWDTLELTREHVRCTKAQPAPADSVARARCDGIAKEFAAKRAEYQQMSQQVQQVGGMYDRVVRVLGSVVPADSLTTERVTALTPASDSVRTARDLFLRMAASGITGEAISDAREDL